jgi:hypothetical protein
MKPLFESLGRVILILQRGIEKLLICALFRV